MTGTPPADPPGTVPPGTVPSDTVPSDTVPPTVVPPAVVPPAVVPPTVLPPTVAPPTGDRRAKSLFLVATGDGKGKTTAAMGTALRALERGWGVCVVQFVKSGKWKSGEARLLAELGAEWHAMGDGFTWDSEDLGRSADMAREAWELSKEAITSARYGLVVLDELTYPVNWGWVSSADVAGTIESRPDSVNVFVTGRDAPASLVNIADTVTEMRNVKHAYEAGIKAAKGIDF